MGSEHFSNESGFNNPDLIRWLRQRVGRFEGHAFSADRHRVTTSGVVNISPRTALQNLTRFNTGVGLGGSSRNAFSLTEDNFIAASLLDFGRRRQPLVINRTTTTTTSNSSFGIQEQMQSIVLRKTSPETILATAVAVSNNVEETLRLGEFLVEDMRRFLVNDLPNIIILVLKRFYFTLNKEEVSVLLAKAKVAVSILETSLNIVINPENATTVRD